MPDMGETLVLFSHMTELAFGVNIYHFFLPWFSLGDCASCLPGGLGASMGC